MLQPHTKSLSINDKAHSLPFGAIQGTTAEGVVSYSSDYDSVDGSQYPNRKAFRSYYDGIYMGYKWQCVEFARRWLYINLGLVFNDVSMAYEIFKLRAIRDVVNSTELPLNAFANGSLRRPEVGCMLIWDEGGEFEHTGHIAIVTEVFDDKIRVAEQNMNFTPWPAGQSYSREIEAKIGAKGDYWLKCAYTGSSILGWVIQTPDTRHSVQLPEENPALFKIKLTEHNASDCIDRPWLNIANEDEAAYVDMMKGHWLTSVEEDYFKYFAVSQSAVDSLESATDELHGLFMHATDYVLQHPELLHSFALPSAILAKVMRSWDNRNNQLITSRFDFAMTDQGLKVYEYNCDSASCYMEAGKVQGKWAWHLGIKSGDDNGADLFKALVKAWQECDVVDVQNGTIHVLQDIDPEEDYHALFMKKAIEAAGFNCVRVIGLSTLTFGEQGEILDQHGNPIRWVWKTWAWETALNQLRKEEEQEALESHQARVTQPQIVELSDVLLNDDIMVYEPLWTLIPSNKAILPVLWSLFPNHPLLLNTSFELSDELKATGYVSKPIVGRCGENIQLIDADNQVLANKGGAFAERQQIYQQLFALPKIDNYYVQICTFTAAGHYAGSNVRVDKSMIIGKDSDCMALRTLDDQAFLTL
ncbi:glutathionylspermidine synthase family protein [Paraglaciecola polaris]|uniref:Glutathionylspermidine amidase/synthetase n=1 Tax=Paraglaciecola polaris LMG 21857 TaxID=1129793 RepID=K6ZWJ4_9ALTE|nr:glutathionylspermidine synthase family protein [Paraglaciecola polaris]GAC33153.1 glutathionylspermidine amidase/synthetase [Paraglaciecola polaris LMG 21857]